MTTLEQVTLAEAQSRADLVVLLTDATVSKTPAAPSLGDVATSLGLAAAQMQRASTRLLDRDASWRFVVSDDRPDVLVATVDSGPDGAMPSAGAHAGEFAIIAAAVRLAAAVYGTYERVAVVSALTGARADVTLSAALLGLALGAHPTRNTLAGDPAPAQRVLVASDRPVEAALLQRTADYAEATCWARDLVNAAPSAATPGLIAAHVEAELGELPNLKVQVLAGDELTAAGFRAVVAVGTSSQNAPCLVELRYDGAPDQDGHIALVGKGITYDGGGMNVKPAEVQRWMKADMAGGAAVLAAVRGAARRGLRVNIRAVVPLAENLYGERALRQGDVITHLNGLTTEITHTDAEGRLVVADALAHLAAGQPDVLVDVATLTNWILGPDLWMALGNDQDVIEELLSAGHREGEPGWQLPLWPPYADSATSSESSTADLQNYDFREVAPDPIVAAHYLHRFVGEVPWGHLDIVGTAYRTARGHDGLAGATGSATRTLLRFLEDRSAGAAAPASNGAV